MNLLDIYASMQRGDITLEEAATAFGFTTTDMRLRMAKWGHRLPLLLATLDKIKNHNLPRDEAAQVLGVTPRQVNHLMVNWRVDRPIPDYLINNAASQVKWEIRKKFAIEYIAGTCTLEEASENAQVSDRQMRRWVADLLQKHFGMVFKDLREVTPTRRYRLANEIETAEGLELAKQAALRSVVVGEKQIRDEALDRVVSKRVKKRVSNVQRIRDSKPGGAVNDPDQ